MTNRILKALAIGALLLLTWIGLVNVSPPAPSAAPPGVADSAAG